MKKTKQNEMFVVEEKVFSLTNKRDSDGGNYFLAARCNDSNRYILAANKEKTLPDTFEKPNSKLVFVKVYEKMNWQIIAEHTAEQECQDEQLRLNNPNSKRIRKIK